MSDLGNLRALVHSLVNPTNTSQYQRDQQVLTNGFKEPGMFEARAVSTSLTHPYRHVLRFARDSCGPIGAEARATDGLGHHRERAENQVEEQAVSTAILNVNKYTLIQLHCQTGP
jgi:hypothetical protein